MKENKNINKNLQANSIISKTEIIINKDDEEEEENIYNLKVNKIMNNKENSIKENEDIYFKKSIRRNKRGIIEQNNKNFDIKDTSDNRYSNDSNNMQ